MSTIATKTAATRLADCEPIIERGQRAFIVGGIAREIHPAAAIFPMLMEADFAALKEDIRLHGQQEDIALFDGKVLDGRNRLRACNELGIKVRWCELTDSDDPIAYVLSKNLHRRHLSPSQRAQCAADVATLRLGDNQHKKDEGGQICLPTEDAAKVFSVSPSSVKTAKHVKDKGDDTVVEAVKSGVLSVSAAKALVNAVPDKAEQRKLVEAGKDTVIVQTRAKQREADAQQKKTRRRDESKARQKREEADKTAQWKLKAKIDGMPREKNHAVAYILAALGDFGLHAESSLFSSLSKEQLIAAYVNETQSASERQRRLDRLHPSYPPDHLGRQIISSTLAAMVWLGLVKVDGEEGHTAYRLVGPAEASKIAAVDHDHQHDVDDGEATSTMGEKVGSDV